MPQHAIGYVHLERLGGRRKPKPDSHNAAWRLDSFRGYADYMETEEFLDAVSQLKQFASEQRVAFMCSEAVWWRCHRSLVSDYLKAEGWTVMHVLDVGKANEHPYTKPAKVVGNKLSYGA